MKLSHFNFYKERNLKYSTSFMLHLCMYVSYFIQADYYVFCFVLFALLPVFN